jgi:hypothetical protein
MRQISNLQNPSQSTESTESTESNAAIHITTLVTFPIPLRIAQMASLGAAVLNSIADGIEERLRTSGGHANSNVLVSLYRQLAPSAPISGGLKYILYEFNNVRWTVQEPSNGCFLVTLIKSRSTVSPAKTIPKTRSIPQPSAASTMASSTRLVVASIVPSSSLAASNIANQQTQRSSHKASTWSSNIPAVGERPLLFNGQPLIATLANEAVLVDEFVAALLPYLPTIIQSEIKQIDASINDKHPAFGQRLTEIHFTAGHPPSLVLGNGKFLDLQAEIE